MTAGNIAVLILLSICVLSTIVCCLALVVVRDLFDRMHYLAPVASLSILALFGAVVVQEGWGQGTLKTILIVSVLFLVNAVLTHATARAARVRQFGDWLPNPKENILGAPRQDEFPET